MDIIGLGCTANGYPVQVQDQSKILVEMWLEDDTERQKLTKALEKWRRSIKLKFDCKIKILPKLQAIHPIQAHDNNFAKELILHKN